MKIAIINEVSTAGKNANILDALDGFGHHVINVGMSSFIDEPSLSYLETGFLAGILLHLERVDLVVGGCGTGQGFLISAMQYPGVFCGLISDPIDAWLFAQINGGNCLSLPLNKGYGWAGEINIRFIFEKFFSVESGCGYPEERKAPQRISRDKLIGLSQITHKSFSEIVEKIDRDVLKNSLNYPGVWELLDVENIDCDLLKAALKNGRSQDVL